MNAQPTPRRTGRAYPHASRSATARRQYRLVGTERSRRRTASRLAVRLAHDCAIPLRASALAPWLTSKHCSGNADALTCWVQAQLTEPGAADEDPADQHAIPAQRLAHLLADVGEGAWA